jgi:hypothetical protein
MPLRAVTFHRRDHAGQGRRRVDGADVSYEAAPQRSERVLFAVSVAVLMLALIVVAAIWLAR